MNRARRVPLLALLVAWVTMLAHILGTASQLPSRVATHFDLAGKPNGWMSRGTHVSAMLTFGFLVPAFILGIAVLTRYLNGAGCNIPHRDYWLAPERRAATMDFIFDHCVWLGCLLVIFHMGLHQVILWANQARPVALSSVHMTCLSGAMLGGVILWVILLVLRFLRPNAARNP